MPSVLQKIIGQFAPVHQDTDLTQIHTSDVNSMSAYQIQSVPQLLHARMKNVLILANVQGMLIAHQEIIEEFAHVNLDSLEINMALHVLQVRCFS